MNTHAQPLSKPALIPSSFTPVRSNLLQRKCACGGGASQLSGECKGCQNKKMLVQRIASDNVHDERAPQAVAQQALNSSGQPLDAATRASMESSFGHDFGKVRVHTDAKAVSSARALGAHAYTVGSDIAFGEGYAPQTKAGRWMLGHELAHVVQQEGGTHGSGLAESPRHEHEADRAADTVTQGRATHVASGTGAPALQPLKVTTGEFGVELEDFTKKHNVPDDVVKLLKSSAKFMNIAQTLDQHYIALDGSKIITHWANDWEPNKDGVLGKGPFKGRRVLAIWHENIGSSFQPAGSPENEYGYDIIHITTPDVYHGPATEKGGWFEDIAHEATHAMHRVTGSGPAPADVAASIRASVAEEKSTRTTEHAILAEAQKGAASSKLKGYTPKGDSTETSAIERDFFPSKLRRTYLEQFATSKLIEQYASQEGLTQDEMKKRNKEVDDLPLGDASVDRYLTDPFPLYYDKATGIFRIVEAGYRRIRFWQRVMDKRWEKFQKSNSPGDADYETEKEKVIQAHATAFFEGIITYTPRPTPKP
ncbi:MAG: DUF4157 domain-containing protein [Pyrinomonadaceae bacterium]